MRTVTVYYDTGAAQERCTALAQVAVGVAISTPASSFDEGCGLEPTSRQVPGDQADVSARSATALPSGAGLATLALDEQGSIRDCCHVAEGWFDYPRSDLLGLRVSRLLPDLERTSLTHDGFVNPRLAFLSRCGVHFDAIRRSGDRFACWLFFNKLNSPERPPLLILIRAVDGLARAHSAQHGQREITAPHPLVHAAPEALLRVQRVADGSFPS